jgi:alpha-L-rhamnosidase
MNNKIELECFQDPPSEFRPLPFWGLNDELSQDELRRQIQEMKDKGWGGFFPHPRYGMETPYLTRRYLDAMKICVDEARRNKLEVWIYDEHPFPAGCAGGLVGAEQKRNRHQVLVMLRHNRLTPIEEGVAYYGIKLDKGQLTGIKRIQDATRHNSDADSFLHFYTWTAPVQPAFHMGRTDTFIHGFPYTDLLNKRAVRRFIDLTYEAYKGAIGREFGKTVKGAISDIPVYQWHYATPRPSIPWTGELPRIFKKTFGYDLVSRLPELFFDLGQYSRVRQDYWQLVNALFLNNYTIQLAQWCARNKLKYTAHYWGEETLHWQIPWTGDVMTHFAKQHIVSIDHILRNIEDPLGVKQAASVAEQLGKPRLISETYALSGHNLTFEERKWIGDWEYALGVNCLVPYIPSYSMRGRRKRDEPPSEFFQQPYWRHEKSINDYYGRLSYLLTRGKRVVDVLLLQPLRSARILYKPGTAEPAAYRPHADRYEAAGAALYEYSQDFSKICERLLGLHYDFHVGNEELLAEHAKVEGKQIRVGEMKYSLVIVPPSVSWSNSTIKLVNALRARGGKVLVVNPTSESSSDLSGNQPLSGSISIPGNDSEALRSALSSLLEPSITIEKAESLIYQHRHVGEADLYFIANTSLETSYLNTRVTIKGGGCLELWDALSSQQFALEPERHGQDLVCYLDFHPVSSFILVRHKAENSEGLPRYRRLPVEFSKTIKLDDEWQFERRDHNALNIDYCEIDVARSGWTKRIPVWQAHRLLGQAGLGTPFVSRFKFRVVESPGTLLLAIEDPARYVVSVNGKALPKKEIGQWWDSSIRLFDIRSRAKEGENVVELAGIVGLDTEFEGLYLLGDFALRKEDEFVLVREPKHVKGRDVTHEGYPFFTGTFVLKRSLDLKPSKKRAFLRFDQLDAIVTMIRVNGKLADQLLWKPYIVEITNQIIPGSNNLEVELCTSLHNLLGPHHSKKGEARIFVLEHSWTDVANWTDDYFFVPVGCKGAAICYEDC